jgi:putative flippase GtrA
MSEERGRYLAELRSGVRFGKFVSVGAIGAVFDTTALVLLTEVGGMDALVANVFSIELAILVMFTVNERWTFAGEGAATPRAVGRRLLRSHLVRAGGSSLQFLLFAAVFTTFTLQLSIVGIDFWLIAVKGGSIGVAMVVNYVFESLFTWQVHDASTDREKN